jgi:hypothetical protein
MSCQNKVIKKNDFEGKFYKHLENKSRVWLTQHTSMIEKHTFSYHGLLSAWIHGLIDTMDPWTHWYHGSMDSLIPWIHGLIDTKDTWYQ